MSTSKKRLLMLANAERRMVREVEGIRLAIVGLEATLDMPRSKYHGRAGVVTEVAPASDGRMTALLMLMNRKGTHYLNSEPATRQYRKISELKFTGRRVFAPERRRA